MSRSRSRSPLEEVNEEHTANTQLKDSEDVVKDSEDVVKYSEDVVKYSEDVKDSEDVVKDSQDVVKDSKDVVKECNVLHVEKLSLFWNLEQVSTFIREITKSEMILEGLKYVLVLKSKNLVGTLISTGFLAEFESAHICNLAHAEWSAKCELTDIKVKYDLDNLLAKKGKFKRRFNSIPILSKEHPPPKRQRFKEQIKEIQVKNKFERFSKDVDYKETYGLSNDLLCALGLKLPLKPKIYVSNLHPNVTEVHIREVFRLAGHVVSTVLKQKEKHSVTKNFAIVEYDHPVEAVQAISMFNKQKLLSWPMLVTMDSKPYKFPYGLSGIGPGLGPNGQPLKGVRTHLAIESLKTQKRDDIHAQNYGATNANVPCISPYVQPDWSMAVPLASNSPMNVPIPNNSLNPFGSQSSMMNPFMNMQMFQNFSQQNPASFQQAVNMLLQNTMNTSVTGQNSDPGANASSEWLTQPNVFEQNDNAEPKFSVMKNKTNSFETNQQTHIFETNQQTHSFETNQQTHSFEMNRKTNSIETSQKTNSLQSETDEDSDDHHKSYKKYRKYDDKDRSSRESRKSLRDKDISKVDRFKDKSDMLLFKHLPRSVTLQVLKNKMLEVGKLDMIEMTGHGRALVRFYHSYDAQRCIKLFDRSTVDGETIAVRYF